MTVTSTTKERSVYQPSDY